MNDLDSSWHVRRSQAHTELLVQAFELGTLWDEYGLVGDVVVRILLLLLLESNHCRLAVYQRFPSCRYS